MYKQINKAKETLQISKVNVRYTYVTIACQKLNKLDTSFMEPFSNQYGINEYTITNKEDQIFIYAKYNSPLIAAKAAENISDLVRAPIMPSTEDKIENMKKPIATYKIHEQPNEEVIFLQARHVRGKLIVLIKTPTIPNENLLEGFFNKFRENEILT